MINFNDLDEEFIVRLQEIIVDDDSNKSAYLLSRYKDSYDKLDDGEKLYLDWFLYFEDHIVDENGKNIKITNPYTDKNEEMVNSTLFNIMKAGFTLDYRAITDGGNLECIFVNRDHKSFVFVEMNSDGSLIQKTRIIIPMARKKEDEVSLEVFDNLPYNLYRVMDKHHPKDWPFMTIDHPSYFGNSEELNRINNMNVSDVEKDRLIFAIDMIKFDKLPSVKEVVGLNNMLLVKNVSLDINEELMISSKPIQKIKKVDNK